MVSKAQVGRVVEHDQPQNHLFERNLVLRDAFSAKCAVGSTWVPYCSDHSVISGAESILDYGVGLAGFGIGRGGKFRLNQARSIRSLGTE